MPQTPHPYDRISTEPHPGQTGAAATEFERQRTATGQDRVVVSCVRRWGEDLVDLSRRNRLLYFKHLKSGTLQFDQDARTVIAGLRPRRGSAAGWSISVAADDDLLGLPGIPPQQPRSDELVVSATMSKTGTQIATGLRSLHRKARAEFLDAGLWVLYLALGFLHWRDGDEKATSPIYLLPAQLEYRPDSDAWRLSRHNGSEPAINPILAVKLERDFGIVVPALDSLDDDDYPSALAAVRSAVAPAGWSIAETAVLGDLHIPKGRHPSRPPTQRGGHSRPSP